MLSNFSTAGDVLKFKVGVPEMGVFPRTSNVGPLPIAMISRLLVLVVAEALVPYINEHFAGIPLSVHGLGLTDVEVYLQNGVNAFGANIAL